MQYLEKATDVLKTISDKDKMILYECCSDDDTAELKVWWDDHPKEKVRREVLEMVNHEEQTLLHVACHFGNYKIVRDLIKLYEEYDMKFNKLDRYHDTPFNLACQRGYSKFEEDSVKFDTKTNTERSARYKICLLFLDHKITIDMDHVIRVGLLL